MCVVNWPMWSTRVQLVIRFVIWRNVSNWPIRQQMWTFQKTDSSVHLLVQLFNVCGELTNVIDERPFGAQIRHLAQCVQLANLSTNVNISANGCNCQSVGPAVKCVWWTDQCDRWESIRCSDSPFGAMCPICQSINKCEHFSKQMQLPVCWPSC